MDDIKIAGIKTINDWRNLVGVEKEQKINYTSNEKWDEVFHFFEERIRTRYLNPIDVILNMPGKVGEGFAAVNLQCSLIETIESFINGCIHKYDNNSEKLKWKRKGKIIFHSNKSIFKSFFANRIIIKDLKIDGGDFYESVRCGLLHETQTKNNWKIKKGIENGNAFELDGYFKIIYRENFQRDLKLLIDRYKDVIINGGEFDGICACELRENFIAKFKHICDES
jgi:hypothetical protein